MYDDVGIYERTFDWDGLPEYLRQAQWAEFTKLKEVIDQLAKNKGAKISILDIGVGDGRLLKHLVPIEEIWSKVETYHAIDNTQQCTGATNSLLDKIGNPSNITVQLIDAENIDSTSKKYDLIITTWFTTGNFYPKDFPFETYNESNEKVNLDTNIRFSTIFENAYKALLTNGVLLFGSMYKENDETRKKQESFYKYFGMDVITQADEVFTATKQGFWSQRFSKERLEKYLESIPKNNFEYVDLDTYDFAMMVKITKT